MSDPGAAPPYVKLIEAAADRAPGQDAAEMAAILAAHPGVLGVVFYGNMLRDREAPGLMDFYVLTESDAAYHGHGPSAFFNRLLPPNVYFEEVGPGGSAAKVAVMRLEVFRHRMRRQSWDTTLWARFCQPALVVHARDNAARARIIAALVEAHETAAWWARHLADPGGAEDTWKTLFAHTYGAELRVEGQGRMTEIVDRAHPLYKELYEALIAPKVTDTAEKARAARAWRLRRLVGKPLNLARLIKAAATFRGGIAYALSKVERHTGRPVELRPWERRVPWLAAPVVLIRLLWQKRLR
ncbi:MAG: hypothetical protein AAF415_10315 [Pseudomonadota bacterium]